MDNKFSRELTRMVADNNSKEISTLIDADEYE